MCDQHQKCGKLFKCKSKNSTVCIHLGDVCDRKSDCPHGEDEEMCEAHRVGCPHICTCLAFAIKCIFVEIKIRKMPNEFLFASVSITHSKIYGLTHFFNKIKSTSFLDLSKNNISNFCPLTQTFVYLRVLDVSANIISKVLQHCVSNLHQLFAVRLENNAVCQIEAESFHNLTNLLLLNVSNNVIKIFDISWIWWESQRGKIWLSVQNNSFQQIEFLLEEQRMILLETTDFRLCCVYLGNCNHLKPWYIECKNILLSTSMQVSQISLSVVIGCVNIVSIIVQVISIKKTRKFRRMNPSARQKNSCFEVAVMSVNVHDIFFDVYLCIMWISSFIHTPYIFEDWRGHPACFTAFGFVLMFSFASPLLLSFLSLMRFKVISKPMSTNFLHKKFVLHCLGFICLPLFVVCFVLTLLSLLLFKLLPFNLCLPFVDPSKTQILPNIVVALVTSLELASSIFIAVFYCLLVTAKKKSQNISSGTSKNADKGMIFQLITVTLSNVLCWFPSGIMFVTCVFLDRYPIDMIAWITIFVLPINSIVNPVIFATTTLRKMLTSN